MRIHFLKSSGIKQSKLHSIIKINGCLSGQYGAIRQNNGNFNEKIDKWIKTELKSDIEAYNHKYIIILRNN